MGLSWPAVSLQSAIADTGRTLARLSGRELRNGVHEVKELGPALRTSLLRAGLAPGRVALEETTALANWNRPTSKVDLVIYGPSGGVEAVAELKAWDIGHQLFDLAKVACLLAGGAPTGFLICVARTEGDFDRMPGGELFPAVEGEVRQHEFLDLISRHRAEWRHHVQTQRPGPTSVPSALTTTSVSAGVQLDAYPGHCMRAVEVSVCHSTYVRLTNGWPAGVSPAS